MAATISPIQTKHKLVATLKLLYPEIEFTEGNSFSYTYGGNTITYPINNSNTDRFSYSLLHEIGHAIELHNNFKNDLELLKIERSAWENAIIIGQKIDILISKEHIEKCMDTYRDWLYARSLCPYCHQCGLQSSTTEYTCLFCRNRWRVSKSRLCRVTRRQALKK